MATEEAKPIVSDDNVLRLRRCPNCGYSLEGLPASGACPECGTKYSEEEMVLYGWAARSRIPVRSPQEARNYAILGVAIAVVGLIFKLDTSNREFLWLTWFGLAFALQMLAFWSALRKFSADNTGPRQLRLSRHGYGSRIGKGNIDLRPWEQGIYVFAYRRTPRSFRLHIHKLPGKIQFKMFDRPFVPIEFIMNGDLALAERILTKMGKWWKIRPTSEVEPPFYRRTLKLGPFGKEVEVRTSAENEIAK